MRNHHNPLINPMCPTPDRVWDHTGLRWWPKGLAWHSRDLDLWTTAGRRSVPVATYTIKSKGRTGAKARQKLMNSTRYAIRLSR